MTGACGLSSDNEMSAHRISAVNEKFELLSDLGVH